ncbi:hypothetical protein scyTo_0016552, partial [Scyliorhinus torazame]|nr:hypothetical protein [Scyliorhinus torazame]
MGSPNEGRWNSLPVIILSSTPTYQTKINEQPERTTVEQDTNKGSLEDWDSARNLITPTSAIPWQAEHTDPSFGDASSSGLHPTLASTVSNGNQNRYSSSDNDWNSIYPDTEGTQGTSFNPHFLHVPPLFVILHTDWNTAMAEWGLAWDLHVYGLG